MAICDPSQLDKWHCQYQVLSFLQFKSTMIYYSTPICVSGVVPVVLLDVRDHKYRDPVLLSDSLQDPGLAHSAPGDAAGGPGPDVDHPLAERGHVQPGAGLHHVW